MQCFDWDEITCNMHNVGLTTESVCAMKAKITCWGRRRRRRRRRRKKKVHN